MDSLDSKIERLFRLYEELSALAQENGNISQLDVACIWLQQEIGYLSFEKLRQGKANG